MENSVRQMVPAAMISLREKIQAWRSNKQQRRMPSELWVEAVSLARVFGVHPVSKNVEVSYTSLKKLVDGQSLSAPPAHFVEVSRGNRRTGSSIEITRMDGCRMSVHDADEKMVAEVTALFLGMRQ